MSNLSAKKHTLKVEFNNGGSATTHFMIQNNNGGSGSGNPDTGDVIFKWIGLLILSIVGLGSGTIFIMKFVKQ